MKVLHAQVCDISDKGAESLARALSVNSSLEELDISDTSIGDEGVAHIASALQTNTTMQVLDVKNCGISDKGAESLARTLAASSSLESLDISSNSIGDDGIVRIATALQANNALNSLRINNDGTDTATDEAALSLAAALTTTTSMEVMRLSWTSTRPDTTLKKMAKRIKKSTLRELDLDIYMPQVSVENEREWYRRVEVGGKKFILSLKDSRLESFSLTHYNFLKYDIDEKNSQVCMALEGAAASVNSKRKINYLPEITFSIHVQ